MKLVFEPRGWRDYLSWQATDPRMLQRINALIEDVRRSPFKGIGKPEPLRNALRGFWSRRITDEHRLVYRVAGTESDQRVEVAQCRSHY